jgi:hypothetical protein
MNKLPPLHPTSKNEQLQRKLKDWLVEWNTEQVMAEKLSSAIPVHAPPVHGADLTPGCILLLCPTSRPLSARPRYIAILDTHHDDPKLVAPFSRFSTPATPGELDLGGESLLTRVLCVWNARLCSMLPSGWMVGTLTEQERLNALEVYASLIENKPVEAFLHDQIGPPLQHPLDPRWEYLDAERDWVDLCLSGKRIHPLSIYQRSSTPLPKAAEHRANYQTNDNTKNAP